MSLQIFEDYFINESMLPHIIGEGLALSANLLQILLFILILVKNIKMKKVINDSRKKSRDQPFNIHETRYGELPTRTKTGKELTERTYLTPIEPQTESNGSAEYIEMKEGEDGNQYEAINPKPINYDKFNRLPLPNVPIMSTYDKIKEKVNSTIQYVDMELKKAEEVKEEPKIDYESSGLVDPTEGYLKILGNQYEEPPKEVNEYEEVETFKK